MSGSVLHKLLPHKKRTVIRSSENIACDRLTNGNEFGQNDGKTQIYCASETLFGPSVPTKSFLPRVISDEQECESPTHERGDEQKEMSKKKKKKKKRKYLSICTSSCKYDVVRRVALKYGMREVKEDDSWNLFWTDLSVSIERAKEMKRFQKINHFPGMIEICRKDMLARNLNRMQKLFPKDFNFFPMTWCLPHDYGEFQNYARNKRTKTYICKPDTGCQGRGIYLTKNCKEIKPTDRMICQIYIPNPFLIDGLKFDLRIYTLITSCDPLRLFVYNDGLARFATSPYREPTLTNSSNVFMHLTNYAVNKHSRTYKVDEEAGTKRKLSTLNRYLHGRNVNVQQMWAQIDEVIVKTVIAAYPTLKHSYHACFPGHDFAYACFELLGFDILLDQNLKPHLLEVNHSPSFHTDAKIDRDIKEGLLRDTFDILNLGQTDKKKIIEEDRRRVRDRLLQGILHKETNNEEIAETLSNHKATQFVWEEKHLGNFRCIYPGTSPEKYIALFSQTSSSLFQDTAASRAREECSRNQRQEAEEKANIEAEKRGLTKKKDLDKLRPESPVTSKLVKKEIRIRKKLSAHPRKLIPGSQDYEKLNSFAPDTILETEERERRNGLSQRDYLIKSFGIIEQIYTAMLKNGSLRDADKKKYCSYAYSKSSSVATIHSVISQKLPEVVLSNVNHSIDEKQENAQLVRTPLDLSVKCSNAPITIRPPAISRSLWAEDRIKNNKTVGERSVSNNVKLQSLVHRETSHD